MRIHTFVTKKKNKIRNGSLFLDKCDIVLWTAVTQMFYSVDENS